MENQEKIEATLHLILGAVRRDLRPLACAVAVMAARLFERGLNEREIMVSKDVYPCVSARLGGTLPATARQIERLANLCWDELTARGLVETYLGSPLADPPTPAELIVYLAYYIALDTPYFSYYREKIRTKALAKL